MPSQNSFDSKKHLSWGDVVVDNPMHPTMLRVKLKCSKTDQFGKWVEVYVGKTGCLHGLPGLTEGCLLPV